MDKRVIRSEEELIEAFGQPYDNHPFALVPPEYLFEVVNPPDEVGIIQIVQTDEMIHAGENSIEQRNHPGQHNA